MNPKKSSWKDLWNTGAELPWKDRWNKAAELHYGIPHKNQLINNIALFCAGFLVVFSLVQGQFKAALAYFVIFVAVYFKKRIDQRSVPDTEEKHPDN